MERAWLRFWSARVWRGSKASVTFCRAVKNPVLTSIDSPLWRNRPSRSESAPGPPLLKRRRAIDLANQPFINRQIRKGRARVSRQIKSADRKLLSCVFRRSDVGKIRSEFETNQRRCYCRGGCVSRNPTVSKPHFCLYSFPFGSRLVDTTD